MDVPTRGHPFEPKYRRISFRLRSKPEPDLIQPVVPAPQAKSLPEGELERHPGAPLDGLTIHDHGLVSPATYGLQRRFVERRVTLQDRRLDDIAGARND